MALNVTFEDFTGLILGLFLWTPTRQPCCGLRKAIQFAMNRGTLIL